MALSSISRSLPIKLGLDTVFSSYLIQSVQVITSSQLLTYPEQFFLECAYFITMYYHGSADNDESFVKALFKTVKAVCFSTIFVSLLFQASKKYRYIPLKQTGIFAVGFICVFSFISQVTFYVLSCVDKAEFMMKREKRELSRSFSTPSSSPPSYSDIFGHFSEGGRSLSFPNAESLIKQCEKLIANHEDTSHLVEPIQEQLQEYESLDPKVVCELFKLLKKIGLDEKLDTEHNSRLGYWLLNQGIKIEPFCQYYGIVQRILKRIARRPIEELTGALHDDDKVLDAYHNLFFQTTAEGFQVLPIDHQVCLNLQFFEKKGAEHCFSFRLIDIEQVLYKRVSSSLKLLRILHHQLCVRTRDIEKIQPHGVRRSLKDTLDKHRLPRK